MSTESHLGRPLYPVIPWLPATGHQLRKAGVYFDAVRLAGQRGHQLADMLAQLTGGLPGPVIEEATGERFTYFLVPPGSTARRRWPQGVQQLPGGRGDAYVGVPALHGHTWPLTWRYPPDPEGRMVHPAILHALLCASAATEGGYGG